MKKTLLLFIINLLFTTLIYSQESASVVWSLIVTDSLKVSSKIGNVLGQKELISAGPNGMVVASYNSNGQRLNQGSFGWVQETAQNDTRFIQFSASPAAGNNFTVTNVSFNYGFAGSTSAMNSNVYYSTDNWVTRTKMNSDVGTLVYGNSSGATYSKSLSVTVPDGSVFSVRIYLWWSITTTTSPTKYAVHNTFTISGATSPSGPGSQLNLITSNISGITDISAFGGGSILNDGGKVVTERGICWNANSNPTINNFKLTIGSGLGDFSGVINSLQPSTKYYVRAYAINADGISYGNEVSFITLAKQILSFPTAEGYGRFTIGGRGGKVFEVSNLNDDVNPGSLRYAINQTGPRTIVFTVSGTIFLKSSLSIKNGDLTIAGQTAPGDGICVAGYTPSVDADNVIVRFVRFRLGDINNVEDDAFNGRNHKNIIIDHCSMTWSVDETASFYDNENFTMQWCIIGESLYNSSHPKGAHGYGGIQGGWGATFHHNLYIHNTSRNPRFCGARYHTSTYTSEIVDFVNNVVYNWGFNTVYGGELGQQNVRANYYKPGPATKSGVLNRILNPSISTDPVADYGKFYVADNYVFGFANTTSDNWTTGVQGVSDAIKAKVKVTQPFPIADVKTHPAELAYQAVLQVVGANFPKRDAVDLRLIEDTRTGKATYEGKTYKQSNSVPDPSKITGIIDSQTDVGGWPVLNSLPAPLDSDYDGMPDEWEKKQNLNPNDANDRNNLSSSGYTMLEEYINGLVTAAVTDVKDNIELPTSFSITQNYPNPFNPTTRLEYSLPLTRHLEINIYNVQGQLIKKVFSGEKSAGSYTVDWNGENENGIKVGSGIYFCSFRADNYIKTIKMTLLK